MVKAVTAAGAAMTVLPLITLLLAAASLDLPTQLGDAAGLRGVPTSLAERDIPPGYLALYAGAARSCPGLPWSVLAGIGKVESDHGRSASPGVRSSANSAGAEGPMQLLPRTFARYAVDASPSRPPSPYDPADAIYAAARMLCANGARGGSSPGLKQAISAYNHAAGYVTEVLSWAARYAEQGSTSVAIAATAFAEAQLGKPYAWGADGPEAYDCSGLVYAAYAAAGIRIGRTTFEWRQDGPLVGLTKIQPGDLLFSAGSDGTVDNPGHVVMYLGDGEVIQAPQAGENVQIDPLDLASVVVATRPADLAHPK